MPDPEPYCIRQRTTAAAAAGGVAAVHSVGLHRDFGKSSQLGPEHVPCMPDAERGGGYNLLHPDMPSFPLAATELTRHKAVSDLTHWMG